MKKFFSSLIALALAFAGFTTLSTSAAVADNRMTISADTHNILIGSTATVTAAANFSDGATYSWDTLRWEVAATQNTIFSAVASPFQKISSGCEGRLGIYNSNLQICSTEFNAKLSSFSAPTTASYRNNMQFSLVQSSGQSQIFRVRAWLDGNNNGTVDPFELASPFTSIQTVEATEAKAFMNFEVDPPRFSEGKITATLSGGNSAYKAMDLIDADLIEIRVNICGTVSCSPISGSVSYNAYPQFLRWEFVTPVTFQYKGQYAVEVIYNQDANVSHVLETVNFDYRQHLPSGLKTQITPQSGTRSLTVKTDGTRAPRLSTTVANRSVDSFDYVATLVDKDAALVAKREVYVFVDLKDLNEPTDLLVDGVQIAAEDRDQVVLSRTTDANGVLKLKFEYPEPSQNEKVEIDIQINGMRPYEFSDPGSEEAFLWDIASSRGLSVWASDTSGTSREPITLYGIVQSEFGSPVQEGSVIFSAEPGLIVSKVAHPVSRSGSVSSVVRISNRAPEKGTANVIAQYLTPNGWASVKIPVSWTGFGKSIKVTAPTAKTVTKGLTHVEFSNYQAVFNVMGLDKSDVVIIYRNGVASKLKSNSTTGVATQTFGGTSTSKNKYRVTVNGKNVYTASHQ